MADEEKPEEAEENAAQEEGQEEKPKKNKGPLKLLLAVVLLVAVGGGLAMMAVPKKESTPKFQGPYFMTLLEDFNVSTPDNNMSRYAKFKVSTEYAAYEEAYLTARVGDPEFMTNLTSVAQREASARSLTETVIGPKRDEFAMVLRTTLDPVVFPVHIGDTATPLSQDSASGIVPGVSHRHATFRGRFHDHTLKINSKTGIIQIDDGPEMTFRGDEDDLEVKDARGDTIYVDMTRIAEDFEGEVQVGVHGKLRTIIFEAIGQ